jgi:predicted negative regulator of RcsB-dependent stress response
MVEIYDSHEQSERVKGWLRENGGAMVLGLILAFGGLYGFKQWQLWTQSKDQQASAEYQVMVELLGNGNLDGAVANYETLKAEFSKSSYTALAALHMASARIDAGQGDLAMPMLEYAMNQAEPDAVRIVARERLARVKLDLGDAQGAMELLDAAPDQTGFEARFAEIRGDILRQQGDAASAVEQYRLALSLIEEGVGDRNFLQLKIDSLEGLIARDTDA